MENKIDRRILKSQRIIKQTFLEILIEEGFDEITIKKIAEKADISRKTFYLHYLDKYDLLDTIVNDELKELNNICEIKKSMGMIEGTIIWFEYFEGKKEFFKALFLSKSTVSFREKLLEFMMKQIKEKMKDDSTIKDDIMIKFFGMGTLGIIESFVLGELEGDAEDLAIVVGELLKRNLYNS